MNHSPSIIYSGRAIALKQQLTIGRHPQNDLSLQDDSVSRQHAIIIYQNGHWMLYDQRSSYGTYVNGQRITNHALRPGDRIQIGAVTLVFQASQQAIQSWEQPTRYQQAHPGSRQGSNLSVQHFWHNLTQGRKFSVSGAVLALICFVLPWTRLSCAGQTRDFSGYQMAAGTTQLDGITYLWLVPIAAIAIVTFIFLRYSGRRRGPQATSRWELAASGVGLLATLLLIIAPPESYREAKQMGVEVRLLLGYWGTLAGFLLAVWGSYRDYQESG